MHVSLTQQVQQVEDTYEQLSLALGEAAAANLFQRSVFFVSIGSNDFIHYYLRNVSGVQMRYLPWEFNQLLVSTMRQEIKVSFLFSYGLVHVVNCDRSLCLSYFHLQSA